MLTGKTEKRMRWHIWMLLVLAGLIGTSRAVRAAEHQARPSDREVFGDPLFNLPRAARRGWQA